MVYNPLNFPTSTIVAKNVPKNAFYKRAKAQRTTALRIFLTEAFESILWLYKLHPSTLNIADGATGTRDRCVYYKMSTTHIDERHSLRTRYALTPTHALYHGPWRKNWPNDVPQNNQRTGAHRTEWEDGSMDECWSVLPRRLRLQGTTWICSMATS